MIKLILLLTLISAEPHLASAQTLIPSFFNSPQLSDSLAAGASLSADSDADEVLNAAVDAASPKAKSVLTMGRVMVSDGTIVVGSCWDYINAVYNRAGFATSARATPFKSTLKGPYADSAILQAGDWLYFINHSFGDVEHSAIFIAWSDQAAKQAWMLSYAGGNHAVPARYQVYDLSSVYNIMRPK